MEQIYDLRLRQLETYRNNSERAADAQEMETLWNCKGKGAGKQSQIWKCPIDICQLFLNSLPGLFWKECSDIDNLLAIFPPSQILRLSSDSRQLGGGN